LVSGFEVVMYIFNLFLCNRSFVENLAAPVGNGCSGLFEVLTFYSPSISTSYNFSGKDFPYQTFDFQFKYGMSFPLLLQ